MAKTFADLINPEEEGKDKLTLRKLSSEEVKNWTKAPAKVETFAPLVDASSLFSSEISTGESSGKKASELFAPKLLSPAELRKMNALLRPVLKGGEQPVVSEILAEPTLQNLSLMRHYTPLEITGLKGQARRISLLRQESMKEAEEAYKRVIAALKEGDLVRDFIADKENLSPLKPLFEPPPTTTIYNPGVSKLEKYLNISSRIKAHSGLPPKTILGKNGILARAWRGDTDPFVITEIIPWVKGVFEAADLAPFVLAARRVEKNEASSMDIVLTGEGILHMAENSSWQKKIFDGVVQLPAFVIQFATTDGIYNAFRQGGIKAAEKYSATLANTLIRRGAMNTAVKEAFELGVKGGTIAAGGAAQWLIGFAPDQAVYTLSRMTPEFLGGPGEDLGEAFFKATGQGMIEVLTERLGGYAEKRLLPRVSDWWAELPMGRKQAAIKEMLKSKFLKVAPKSLMNNGKRLARFLEKGGYNGVVLELGEEYAGDVLNNKLGFSDQLFPSWQDQLIRAATFLAFPALQFPINWMSSKSGMLEDEIRDKFKLDIQQNFATFDQYRQKMLEAGVPEHQVRRVFPSFVQAVSNLAAQQNMTPEEFLKRDFASPGLELEYIKGEVEEEDFLTYAGLSETAKTRELPEIKKPSVDPGVEYVTSTLNKGKAQKIEILINPSSSEIASQQKEGWLRGLVTPEGNLYTWQGGSLIHQEVVDALAGRDPSLTGAVRFMLSRPRPDAQKGLLETDLSVYGNEFVSTTAEKAVEKESPKQATRRQELLALVDKSRKIIDQNSSLRAFFGGKPSLGAERLFSYDANMKKHYGFTTLLKNKLAFFVRGGLDESTAASTYMHELVHVLTPFLPAESINAIRKALGKEIGEEATLEDDELLAKKWESYLQAGEAPSRDLIPAFRLMRDYMRDEHRKGTLSYGWDNPVPLPPEIRAVFDRMLVDDKPEITAKREEVYDLVAKLRALPARESMKGFSSEWFLSIPKTRAEWEAVHQELQGLVGDSEDPSQHSLGVLKVSVLARKLDLLEALLGDKLPKPDTVTEEETEPLIPSTYSGLLRYINKIVASNAWKEWEKGDVQDKLDALWELATTRVLAQLGPDVDITGKEDVKAAYDLISDEFGKLVRNFVPSTEHAKLAAELSDRHGELKALQETTGIDWKELYEKKDHAWTVPWKKLKGKLEAPSALKKDLARRTRWIGAWISAAYTIRGTEPGKLTNNLLDHMEAEAQMIMGPFRTMFDEIFPLLKESDTQWLNEQDETFRFSNFQRMTDPRMPEELKLLPPNERVAKYVALWRDTQHLLGWMAHNSEVKQHIEGGATRSFEPPSYPHPPRMLHQDLYRIIDEGAEDELLEIAVALQIVYGALGIKNFKPEEFVSSLKEEFKHGSMVRRAGELSYLRKLSLLPSSVKLVSGRIQPLLQSDPHDLYLRTLDRQARTIALARSGAQERWYQVGKGGLRSRAKMLNKLLGIKYTYEKSDLIAKLLKAGVKVDPLKLASRTIETIKKLAKKRGLDTQMSLGEFLDELESLAPSQMSEGQRRSLISWAKRNKVPVQEYAGTEEGKNKFEPRAMSDILHDVLYRFHTDSENVLDVLRKRHILSGGSARHFNLAVAMWSKLPVWKVSRGEAARLMRASFDVVATGMASMQTVPNIFQTLLISRHAGVKRLMQGYALAMSDPMFTESQLMAIGAINTALTHWNLEPGRMVEGLGRNFREVVGIALGQRFLYRFNNLVAGAVGMRLAAEWEAWGLRKHGDKQLARTIGLTEEEISSLAGRHNKMSESMRTQIVRGLISHTQYTTTAGHRRGVLEAHPLLRMLVTFFQYTAGMTRDTVATVGAYGKELKEAALHPSKESLGNASKTTMKILFGLGVASQTGVLQNVARAIATGAIYAQPPDDVWEKTKEEKDAEHKIGRIDLDATLKTFAKGLVEIQTLGGAQRMMDPFYYGGWKDGALVAISPYIRGVTDSLLLGVHAAISGVNKMTGNDMLGWFEWKYLSFPEHLKRTVKRDVPVVRALVNHINHFAWPNMAENLQMYKIRSQYFDRLREAKQISPERAVKGYAPVQRNVRLRAAITREDQEGLSEAIKLWIEEKIKETDNPEIINEVGRDLDQALKDQTLLGGLREEDIDYLESHLKPKIWDQMIKVDTRQMQLISAAKQEINYEGIYAKVLGRMAESYEKALEFRRKPDSGEGE